MPSSRAGTNPRAATLSRSARPGQRPRITNRPFSSEKAVAGSRPPARSCRVSSWTGFDSATEMRAPATGRSSGSAIRPSIRASGVSSIAKARNGMIASAKNSFLNGVLVRSFIQASAVPRISAKVDVPAANTTEFTNSRKVSVER